MTLRGRGKGTGPRPRMFQVDMGEPVGEGGEGGTFKGEERWISRHASLTHTSWLSPPLLPACWLTLTSWRFPPYMSSYVPTCSLTHTPGSPYPNCLPVR